MFQSQSKNIETCVFDVRHNRLECATNVGETDTAERMNYYGLLL